MVVAIMAWLEARADKRIKGIVDAWEAEEAEVNIK